MDFDTSVFWPAFKEAGMLCEARYQPSIGPLVIFDVGFKQPDQIVLDGLVSATDYSIEYQSADVTLKRDYVLQIKGVNYRVGQTPQALGNGTFVFAQLEKVKP
jgi:hypothetical protein